MHCLNATLRTPSQMNALALAFKGHLSIEGKKTLTSQAQIYSVQLLPSYAVNNGQFCKDLAI